jgi:tetraacyldisaccharide-1-P 4'-kinase
VIDHQTVFTLRPQLEPARSLSTYGEPFECAGCTGAVAVAGIARPQRFFTAAAQTAWDVRREIAYPDHHWYTERDVARVEAQAREVGASLILTTEKDAVRLEPLVRQRELAWAYLPLQVAVEPAEAFAPWLLERVQGARR